MNGNAKKSKETNECWLNERISKLRNSMPPEMLSYNQNCYFGETTAQEITAWIGLTYLRGLLCQNNHKTKTLFNDKTGHPVFSATMGKDRFKFQMANVRFDDEVTRPKRGNKDRFAAFRYMFEMFNTQCAKALRHSNQ